MAKGTLESLPRSVPNLRKKVTASNGQLKTLQEYFTKGNGASLQDYAVVNASHLQRKVKISMEGIMVMFLLILLLIITSIIK
jgi:hypothetical protein